MADSETEHKRRPVIVVATRIEEGRMHREEQLAPNECGARVFIDAILSAGGLPVQMALTDDEDVIDSYVELADGVAIPGLSLIHISEPTRLREGSRMPSSA